MCFSNMGFNLTILKISPKLFVCYTECAAAQIDNFINALICSRKMLCAVMMML